MHQPTPNIILLDNMHILTEGLVDERLDMNDREFRPRNHFSGHGLCKRHEYLGESLLDDVWFRSWKMIELPLVRPPTKCLLGNWTCC